MENASEENDWYLARDGQRYGPIPEQDLQNLIAKGQLKPEDLVWKKGFEQWVEASAVPGLLTGLQGDVAGELSHAHETQQTALHHSSMVSSESDHYSAHEPAQAESSYIEDTELRAEPVFDRPVTSDDIAHSDQAYHDGLPPKRRKSFARRFFSVILFLLILGGIALFALPAIIPADFIREYIARIVKEQTGRTLTVKGKSSFSLIPYIGVRMRDASISNPEGMSGDPVIQTEFFEIQLKFWPLLEQKLEVERILLKKPHVAFKVDGRGRDNWTFTELYNANMSANQTAKAPTSSTTLPKPYKAGFLDDIFSGSGEISYDAILKNINLREIKVEEGKVSYYNEKTGFSESFDQVEGTVTMPTTSKSMIVLGEGKWRSENIKYTLTINSPNSLVNGEKAPYTLDLKSKYFLTLLTGEVSWAGGLYLTGKGNEVQVRSLRKLAKWLNHEIAPGSGMESFNVIGDFTVHSERVEIENATVTLDSTSASGQATINLSGKRPYVSARLNSEAVYMSPYFQVAPINKSNLTDSGFSFDQTDGGEGSQKNTGADKSENGFSGNQGFENNEGEEEVQSDAPQLSARPINTFASSLQVFDADINFNTDKILFEKLLVGPSQFNIKIRKGDLTAKISQMDLYSGSVSGQLQISSDGPLPKFNADLKITDVASVQLLKSLYGFGWVSGKANMALKLSSTGHSKKQIVSELSGQSTITFKDGAVEGINIPANLKILRKVISQSLVPNTALRTQFDKLQATFDFNRGIATNKDLVLVSEALQLKGQGAIDFTRNEIDYKLDTKLVNEAENGKKDAVPVRIKGPLEAPLIKLDVKETLAKNRDVFAQGLNSASIKKREEPGKERAIPAKNQNFEDMIKGVLSGN